MKNIFVIGGGASGITAAIHAKNANTNVTIIDRQSDLGKKILVTGNGKCNYFNEDMNKSHYHSSSNYDFSIINETNINKVKSFFNTLGVVPYIKNGYYYPHSNQAISILNTLNKELRIRNINVITDEIVKSIEYKNNIFNIKTNLNNYECDKVIFTTGSKAYYKFDNNSYEILSNLGHTIIPVLPALVQIKCNDKIFKEIKGVRTNAKLSLYENNELVKESTGELQITDYGLSGICAMQLSSLIAIGLNKKYEEEIKINFVSDLFNTKEELKEYLLSKKELDRTIQEHLDNLMNYKLTNMFIEYTGITGYETIEELSGKELDKLCSLITNMSFKVTGTNDYQEAQICSGGVSLDEVDMNTLESKLIPNLYFAGEVLDVDGECGGYNLGFAWISGIISGESAGDNND